MTSKSGKTRLDEVPFFLWCVARCQRDRGDRAGVDQRIASPTRQEFDRHDRIEWKTGAVDPESLAGDVDTPRLEDQGVNKRFRHTLDREGVVDIAGRGHPAVWCGQADPEQISRDPRQRWDVVGGGAVAVRAKSRPGMINQRLHPVGWWQLAGGNKRGGHLVAATHRVSTHQIRTKQNATGPFWSRFGSLKIDEHPTIDQQLRAVHIAGRVIT